MSRRIKVLISVLGVILLTVMGTATMVMAQEEEEIESVPPAEGWGLMARVAEILDISQDDLASAFEQAREEIREECQATDNGTIYQERAMFRDQWKEKRQEWIEKRQEIGERFQCDGTENQQNMRFRIFQSIRGRHMIAGSRGWQQPEPPELTD